MALQSLTQSVFDTDATCGYCFGCDRVVVVAVMLIILKWELNLKLCAVFDSGEQECSTNFQDLLMTYNCTKHPYY